MDRNVKRDPDGDNKWVVMNGIVDPNESKQSILMSTGQSIHHDQ